MVKVILSAVAVSWIIKTLILDWQDGLPPSLVT